MGMNETARYGARIKQELDKRGWTQADLGEVAGWSQSIVSDLVRGRRTLIPPEVVRTIAKVLDIPIREQLGILGYLEPEKLAPGVAYVIEKGDPREDMLDLVEGLPADYIAAFTGSLRFLVDAIKRNRTGLAPSGDTSNSETVLGSRKGNKAS